VTGRPLYGSGSEVREGAVMEKICVAIRVRPPTRQNSVRGYHWKVLDNSISLLSGAGTVISGHTFAFGAFPSYSNLSRSIRQK
jgi:hypothetical protein